jgi:hypothetical protein
MAAAAINSRVWGRSFLAGFFIGVPRPSMAYGSIASMKFPAPIQAYEHAEKASGCVLKTRCHQAGSGPRTTTKIICVLSTPL